MQNSLKNELQNILSGKNEVKFGNTIQTITNYLGRGEITGTETQIEKHFKKEESKRLINWIENESFWFDDINFENFISEGAEQRVYLKDEFFVLKLNDSIYYETWVDYFDSLLLNNYFFPDTAYQLLGFYLKNEVLYAVVKQRFIKSDEMTDLNNVRNFMMNNNFENIRNNDYYNKELGIILEDLHDENVLTQKGVLYFIDTVFYIKQNHFWKN